MEARPCLFARAAPRPRAPPPSKATRRSARAAASPTPPPTGARTRSAPAPPTRRPPTTQRSWPPSRSLRSGERLGVRRQQLLHPRRIDGAGASQALRQVEDLGHVLDQLHAQKA